MSDDLTIANGQELEQARDFCLSTEVAALQWLGHTEYQLRKFVIPQDNPTPWAQKRQCVRELWSRWTAYQQAIHQRETLAIRLIEIEAEREHLRAPLRRFWSTRYGRAMTRTKLARLDLEEREAQEQLKAIVYDLEQRIIRETATIFQVYRELPLLDVDHLSEAEAQTWAQRQHVTNGGQH